MRVGFRSVKWGMGMGLWDMGPFFSQECTLCSLFVLFEESHIQTAYFFTFLEVIIDIIDISEVVGSKLLSTCISHSHIVYITARNNYYA